MKVSMITFVYVNNSAENCGFAHIYERNPEGKTSYFVKCVLGRNRSFSVKITDQKLLKIYKLVKQFFDFRLILVCNPSASTKTKEEFLP